MQVRASGPPQAPPTATGGWQTPPWQVPVSQASSRSQSIPVPTRAAQVPGHIIAVELQWAGPAHSSSMLQAPPSMTAPESASSQDGGGRLLNTPQPRASKSSRQRRAAAASYVSRMSSIATSH
jgi:hypothetical protein